MGGSGDLTSLDMGLAVPNFSPYAPAEMAVELGFYEEEGVDPNINAYGGGGEVTNALAVGEEEFINSNSISVLLANQEDANLRIVSGYQLRPFGWEMVTAADSNVESVEDLDGRNVGVTARGSTTDHNALFTQATNDVEFGEVVPVGASGLVSSVREGQVAATSMFPSLPQLAEDEEWGRTIFKFEQLGQTLPAPWIASQNAIDKKGDAVEAAIRAIYRAVVHMQENEDESVEFLNGYTEASKPINQWNHDKIISTISTDGEIDGDAVDTMYDVADIAGVENPPGEDEVFDQQFVPLNI